MDAKSVMSGLEGLTENDWRMYHSDSEVRNIAKEALNLLKEQEIQITTMRMIYGSDAKVVGELVRCKDCGDCREDGYCERWHISVKPDFFCADGDDGNLQEGS